MQTFYNIIYLPTFTINLASLFIIKPMFKVFGEHWNNGKIKELTKTIITIILVILAITILVELVCFFIGIPILNIIYGVDVSSYKIDLLILVLSGFFYAIAILILNILTTIREHKRATVIYIITAIIAVVGCNFLVQKFQMRGASIANLLVTMMLAIMLTVVYIWKIHAMPIHKDTNTQK